MPFIPIDIAYRQQLRISYLHLSSYGSSFVHIHEDKGKETLAMVCLHLLMFCIYLTKVEELAKTGDAE